MKQQQKNLYHLGCCCLWLNLLIIAMASLKNSVGVIFNLWAFLMPRYPYIYLCYSYEKTHLYSFTCSSPYPNVSAPFRLVWLVTFACFERHCKQICRRASSSARYAFVTVNCVKRLNIYQANITTFSDIFDNMVTFFYPQWKCSIVLIFSTFFCCALEILFYSNVDGYSVVRI